MAGAPARQGGPGGLALSRATQVLSPGAWARVSTPPSRRLFRGLKMCRRRSPHPPSPSRRLSASHADRSARSGARSSSNRFTFRSIASTAWTCRAGSPARLLAGSSSRAQPAIAVTGSRRSCSEAPASEIGGRSLPPGQQTRDRAELAQRAPDQADEPVAGNVRRRRLNAGRTASDRSCTLSLPSPQRRPRRLGQG